MNGMGGMSGGQGGGHMVKCPLCGGAGVVSAEQAQAVAPVMESAGPPPDAMRAISAAMMSGGGKRGGGHGGHGR